MKKIVALLLVACMIIGSFTACGKNNGGNGTDANGRPKDHVTLKMYFHGSNVSDDKKVLEEVNKYLDEKLNVTLEPIWGTWGDFDTNAVLAINGNDDVDIYFTCSWSADEYNLFAKRGAWVRLDNPENNLLEKYGKEVWNLRPDVLTTGAKIEGSDGFGVYAVPGYKDIACQLC
ncbi:MAG: hypothetical protein J6U10_05100, partial [Lachnospiraceae bacterium]|nr:hypothetical protein [Lachnospiraceae bacterium]